jgi:hypothetical protein
MVLFKNNSYFSNLKENQIFGNFFYDEFLKEYDNAGLIIRTTAGVYLCYVNKKKLEIIPYSDFVADTYHRFIKIKYKDKVNENNKRDEMSSLNFMKKFKE